MRWSVRVACCLLLLAGCAIVARERYSVFFEPGSADLDAGARAVIDNLADKARRRPSVPVTVIGYSDPSGGAPANMVLSARRAEVVTTALVADGVARQQIMRHAQGGVDYAIDSQESRRVDIMLGAQ